MALTLSPLFGVLQIPSVRLAERVGYKKVMVRGWEARSIFVLGMALLPLLPGQVPFSARIYIALVVLTCFSIARGIAVAGHMPWMTQLIPNAWRGRYVAFDQVCISLASAVSMLFSSALLKLFPGIRTYAALFGWNFLAALGSAYLRRVPTVGTSGSASASPERPAWAVMFRHPPFLRLVTFNFCHNLFAAGLGVAWVPFARDGLDISPSLILTMTAFSSMIALFVSLLIGPLADRTGSRPVLALAGGLIVFGQAVCWSLAAGLMPKLTWLVFAVIAINTTGLTTFEIANVRLAMGTMPPQGRSHYFAAHSVAAGLTMGFMPLFWGWLMDHLPPASVGFFNRFSVLYFTFGLGFLGAKFVRRRLIEPQAMSTNSFFQMFFKHSVLQTARLGRALLARRRSG